MKETYVRPEVISHENLTFETCISGVCGPIVKPPIEEWPLPTPKP